MGVVGIDSEPPTKVSVMRARVNVIAMPRASAPPSVVAYTKNQTSLGRIAKRQVVMNPDNTFIPSNASSVVVSTR